MGCGGSSINSNEKDENVHGIVHGQEFSKGGHIDLTLNPNTYITGCKTFYKNQMPNANGDFNDEIFPPNNNSFYGKDKNGNYIDQSNARVKAALGKITIPEAQIVWKKSNDIYGDDCKIFGDDIKIDDISSGLIENAYFIATISAMAEFPQLILQLFKTPTMPDNGCVEVAMEWDGVWTIVCVDDYFPCNKETNRPIFANAKGKELWPLFLEKAWAKVNGGYANIITGNPREVFEVYTPFATVPIDVPTENKISLWNNIRDADSFNCIMTCSIDEHAKNVASVGLQANHCFSLVSAFERMIGMETVRLLKIRNPWGYREWTGSWSDKSDKWTQEAKNVFPEFDDKAENDGIYWMAYEDFINYFTRVSMCVPIKPLFSASFPHSGDCLTKYNVMKVSMPSEAILNISLIKKSWRYHRKVGDKEEVIDNIILAKINRDGRCFEYKASSCNETLSANVAPGEYIIYYNLDYNNGSFDKQRKYTLKIVSNISFLCCKAEDDSDLSLLKTIWKPKVETLDKYSSRFNSDLTFFTGNRFERTSFAFFYMKNNADLPKYVSPQVTFKNIAPINGPLPKTIKLEKGETFVFLGNRIKAYQPFQSSVSVKTEKNVVSTAVKDSINEEKIEKYLSDAAYQDAPISFKFNQV